jgi:Tfp pilus assembly protein FimT
VASLRVCRRCDRPRGFTLVEVMLTFCLLVIIAGLSWPVMKSAFSNQRLRKAADKIRTEWCAARVEAMDSGRTYAFRYFPDEGRFRVECYSTAETADDPVFGTDFDASSGGRGCSGTPQATSEDTLPEGITFLAGTTQQDTRAATITSQAEASFGADTGSCEPILFYPDGSSSSAELVLKNQHERYIKLSLRGLTGVVNVSEVYANEEGL